MMYCQLLIHIYYMVQFYIKIQTDYTPGHSRGLQVLDCTASLSVQFFPPPSDVTLIALVLLCTPSPHVTEQSDQFVFHSPHSQLRGHVVLVDGQFSTIVEFPSHPPPNFSSTVLFRSMVLFPPNAIPQETVQELHCPQAFQLQLTTIFEHK